MSRNTWWWRAAAVALSMAVAGCGSAVPTPAPPLPPGATAARAGVPFTLYTHCGIHELSFGGRWYERVGGPLDDGNGNPPHGWDNPEQQGTLTGSGPTVVFRDRAGHRETFQLRPGATSPKTVCS